MQPHHQINHSDVFYLTVLITVTLESSNSALSDDGDYTETCWSCFNVNFNTSFTAILMCISWQENFVDVSLNAYFKFKYFLKRYMVMSTC